MNVYTTTLLLLLCIACTLESQAFVAPNSGRSATASFQRQMELLYKSSPNHDHSPVAKHYVDSFRNVMAAFLVGFAITFSPSTNPANHAHVWCVANAEETKVTLDPSERTENLQEGGGQQSLLTAPSLVGSQDDHEDSLVEQVWNLIDKYFIDQTFNGQNWKEVEQTYLSQEEPNGNDEKSMQLVTKMSKSLGDKYSRILDVDQYQAIQKYDLIGIGATLMPDQQKHIIVGAPPVAGSASDKAGLKVGDYIDAVNGVPTNGRSAFDLIDQISEDPNAETITMTVRTQGNGDMSESGFTRDVTMSRAFAAVKNPVEYKVSETRKDGTKVGYIRISEFNAIIKAKLQDALNTLEQQGVNAYVIDVRGNPGGAFQSAVEISSLFIDNRVATYVVDANHVELPFRTAAGRVIVDPEDPIAIWVDKNAASASEVFAGSLHDNCRAVIMGENSFGKGKIQAVYGLKNGAGLVLTVAKYITPRGTDIQGAGITPDIEVSLPPPLIPIFSSDTSKVDFSDIAQRLNMCQVPATH